MPEDIQEPKVYDTLSLTSPSFSDGEDIPALYTCDGENINPPLKINGVDGSVQSLVLIMDDPDAPDGVFDHWVVFNIPAETTFIEEGDEPAGVKGKGTSGKNGYYGPCPPGEKHQYVFTLYALDTVLSLEEGVDKEELMEAMTGNVIQKAVLTGYYDR